MSKVYYIVAHHKEEVFQSWLKPYLPKARSILVKDQEGLDTMPKKYNKGMDALRKKLNNNIEKDDIIVFVHEDVKIDDPDFENKLKYYFNIDKKLGVAGVYGSRIWAGGGWWQYDRATHAIGEINQGYNDGKVVRMKDNPTAYSNDLVVVDGCMFAIRAELINKQPFDETLTGWHHYDNSYCIQTLIETEYKIGVIGTLITHSSEGALNQDWVDGAKNLQQKYMEAGYRLPLTSYYLKEKQNEKLNQ